MAASTAATATTQPRGKAAFMEAEELASLRLARELAAAELHGARRLRSRDASSAGASPRPAAAPTPHNVAPTTNVTHAKKEASRPWAMVRNPAQKNLYYRATLQRLGDSVVVQWDGKAWPSSVLPEDSPDIWKGSVRAKDWRYVTSSDGGWLPRGRAAKQQQHKPSVVTKRPAALQQAAQGSEPLQCATRHQVVTGEAQVGGHVEAQALDLLQRVDPRPLLHSGGHTHAARQHGFWAHGTAGFRCPTAGNGEALQHAVGRRHHNPHTVRGPHLLDGLGHIVPRPSCGHATRADFEHPPWLGGSDGGHGGSLRGHHTRVAQRPISWWQRLAYQHLQC